MFYLTQLSVDVLGYDIVCVDIVCVDIVCVDIVCVDIVCVDIVCVDIICVDSVCVTDGMLHIRTIPLMWLQMYMSIIYDTVQPALMVSL